MKTNEQKQSIVIRIMILIVLSLINKFSIFSFIIGVALLRLGFYAPILNSNKE